ncbi:MAG: ParB N-terminal domain-containing protein [Magnetococcales bacterium]|nr:ParB N-terminal domain-containing protein [Magnetococcales bacterium]
MNQKSDQFDKQILNLPIAEIKIGERHRKDMGDIAALASSIEEIGLLQPIGVDKDYNLIFGERRLKAFQNLGRETIPARMVEVQAIVIGEHAENEIRKEFTSTERVSIAKVIEEQLGRRQGQRNDLELRHCGDEVRGRSDDIVAEKAGFGSRRSLRDAQTVVENGIPELREEMDADRIPITAAAEIAKLPEHQQKAELERYQAQRENQSKSKRNASPTNLSGKQDNPPDPLKAIKEEWEKLGATLRRTFCAWACLKPIKEHLNGFDFSNLPDQVREFISRTEYTIEELAKKAGMGSSMLTSILNGKIAPGAYPDVAEKLLDVITHSEEHDDVEGVS